jgi:hypothetical protein
MTNGIKNKIITSAYLLNYIPERGGGTYKSFDLLVYTIKQIIFDDFEYVIYTNRETLDKTDLLNIFNHENVTIKTKELNSEYYTNTLLPYKNKRVSEGEIWDRIHSVENYIEVILNKIEYLLLESRNFDGNVLWIDSGLLGTSCSNSWRDYMRKICHTEDFIRKIFDKINDNDFIALKGNDILFNGVLKNQLNSMIGNDVKIIPGALFGGLSNLVVKYFSEYKSKMAEIISVHGSYSSEQELLYLLLWDKPVKFFEFGDWDDLQRGLLQIMDLYDENKYDKSSIYEYIKSDNENLEITSWVQLADIYGSDKGTLHEAHKYAEIYEKYLSKFKNSSPVIVEIGVNDSRFPGACLKFWDKIFTNMQYFGFDISDCSGLSYNKEKIKIFRGDQSKKEDLFKFLDLNSLHNNLDFVIDDGSHQSEHIITTFEVLYPNLKKDGVYFVESLHATWAERDKTLQLIGNFIENHGYDTKNLYCDGKLLVIKK